MGHWTRTRDEWAGRTSLVHSLGQTRDVGRAGFWGGWVCFDCSWADGWRCEFWAKDVAEAAGPMVGAVDSWAAGYAGLRIQDQISQ
ncbi:hypothetical protein LIER_33764 [Lithospermum erythrorhizon]|uniref:Uncharacterized protein n=1 Tax=Lithospermum erythrorhizon TaxID=34254 RepID=A0AAV3S358_LITER